MNCPECKGTGTTLLFTSADPCKECARKAKQDAEADDLIAAGSPMMTLRTNVEPLTPGTKRYEAVRKVIRELTNAGHLLIPHQDDEITLVDQFANYHPGRGRIAD